MVVGRMANDTCGNPSSFCRVTGALAVKVSLQPERYGSVSSPLILLLRVSIG